MRGFNAFIDLRLTGTVPTGFFLKNKKLPGFSHRKFVDSKINRIFANRNNQCQIH